MGKPKAVAIKVKLPKRLQKLSISKRKSNTNTHTTRNFRSKTVGKLGLKGKSCLKKFPEIFEDPWDGDDEATPIKLWRKKLSILSKARKEKLVSFRNTSQKYPGIYGSLGSQKWIQHFLTFLNDDKVDSKDVQVWIEKYDWICEKNPSIIPQSRITYSPLSPDSDSADSDMDNMSIISDSGVNGEKRDNITARTFEDPLESYMDSGIVKRKSKIIPRDLTFSSCEDSDGFEGQNQA